jgi:hypothetical protein
MLKLMFFLIFSIPLCVSKSIVIKITVKHNLSYLPWLQGVVIKNIKINVFTHNLS